MGASNNKKYLSVAVYYCAGNQCCLSTVTGKKREWVTKQMATVNGKRETSVN